MGGGAWSFLVGGVICLVNSVNERDDDLLNSSIQCLMGEAGERSGWLASLLLLLWILGT